jgi:multidrug transporter EmrE-like cation transporter
VTALYLAAAIAFEVGWAIALKVSDGLTKAGPAVATVVMYILSLVFLALATRNMEIGVGYAIWAGAGVALIALVGIVYFGEPASPAKVVSIAVITAGIVALQLAR